MERIVKHFVVLGVFFAATVVFLMGSASPPDPVHKETKQLMALVREASILVEQQEQEAFAEFKKIGSKWFHDDTYVFVIDLNGHVYVNPSRPELEGQTQITLKDLVGKTFIKSFVRETTGYGSRKEGWSHYVWFRPGEENPMWKTSYVKRVKARSGKEYIVGSGLYDMKMEKLFVVDMVEKAAELLVKKGKQAFPDLKDPLGDFNYLTTYVFILDAHGKDLVNPAFPGFEGQNVRNLKDSTGKYFIRDMMKALDSADSVWIDYLWPKPRQAAPSKKIAYVKKVLLNKEIYYVGSGVYLD
jgi:signal transduction histidine kinase